MKTIHLLLAAVLSFGALQAHARTPVPIINHPNIAVERQASPAEVRKAIMAAAVATGRKWTVSEPRPGVLVATYSVRTHTIVTEITYSGRNFSVAYKDSVNMKYGPGDGAGAGVIHPFYNQWVQEFIQAIRVELART